MTESQTTQSQTTESAGRDPGAPLVWTPELRGMVRKVRRDALRLADMHPTEVIGKMHGAYKIHRAKLLTIRLDTYSKHIEIHAVVEGFKLVCLYSGCSEDRKPFFEPERFAGRWMGYLTRLARGESIG